jgi:flagellar motor switch protein FliG
MPIDYSKLNKIQKTAAFLVTIGPEAAAEVMKGFDNTQLEVICREISTFNVIEPALQQEVMREFASIVSDGVGAVLGGFGFAENVLGRAKGEFAASSILNRSSPGSRSEVCDEIRQMEARQVLNLVKSEQPQTIAFILSNLDTPKAAEIVQMLAPELREEVIERLGSMEPTSHDSIAKVARNLGRHFDKRAQQGLNRSGGVKACADILNALDKQLRNALLTRIEERNEPLGAAIRKKVFSFEDIGKLTAVDLQRVLREVDSSDLPIALKSVKPGVTAAVLAAMSKRAAQALKEEIEMMGPQRVKDVETAQDKIIQVVRRLEEAEEITLDTGGEDRAYV